MSNVIRLKKVSLNLASFALHFVHGGLLVSGALITVLVASVLHSSGGYGTQIREWAGSALSPVIATNLAEKTSAAAGFHLTAEMHRVSEYLSRKYRVAGPAVEPLVAAAHVSGARIGVDPLLVIAVIAVESSFNPIAESVMGAQGLMQVIPRFHQDKLEEYADKDALLDPLTNIEVGTLVLKESMRRAGGLREGLQYYAGASDDLEEAYAAKVLAEKQRLESVLRRPR